MKPFLASAKKWPVSDLHTATIWLWNQPEREFQYAAMNLLAIGRKQWNDASYSLMLGMVAEKSWWDTVDFIAANLLGVWLLQQSPAVRSREARRLSGSDYLWNQRTALIFQLMYKKHTDTELLTELIDTHSGSKEFFIQKAIGWMLRQYARTDAAWVRAFVADRALPKLSEREAIKHLR